jgi:dihydroorotate dehydrogenase (fumarate)
MVDLSVEYLGLKLANPLIVSSSSLTNSPEKVLRCQEAGAGAVVLKSLFEEQIEARTRDLEEQSWPHPHPEAFDYLRRTGRRMGEEEYLALIRASKKAVSIPVIASLNCISPSWWNETAREIEVAGADALELNIALMPADFQRSAADIEKACVRIVSNVRRVCRLPLAVKIGPYFTALPRLAEELRQAGASALVLFNRFYQLDIDIDQPAIVPGYHLSSPEEIYLPLRWIAVLAGRVGCDLAASTGVHDAAGVIKQLLAGAAAVQVCSQLYLKGLERLKAMLAEMGDWMEKHNYRGVADFRGLMSRERSGQPDYYERLQYIKVFVGLE